MHDFEARIAALGDTFSDELIAWVVLPNHYHFLVRAREPFTIMSELGTLHGRTSFEWNGEDGLRGRKVWFNAVETAMKGRAHFGSTLNYIHHNPVKHGYAEKWREWPWSSARDYLECVGLEKAERDWREFSIEGYGKGWDD